MNGHALQCGSALSPAAANGLPRCRGRLSVNALFTKKGKKEQAEAPPKPKKQGFFSQAVEALDFAQTRSEGDRQLLDDAKRSAGRKSQSPDEKKEGGRRGREKMSPEQYAALRRKVGGTARDYWKDYIEADEVEGFKSKGGANVPALPVLVAVVLGIVIATGVVVSQTAGGSSHNPATDPVQEKTPPARQRLSDMG